MSHKSVKEIKKCLKKSVDTYISVFLVPIPFDAEHMFIETIPSVFAVDKDYGWIYLTNIDDLDFQDSRSVLSGKLDVMDMVWFTYRGLHNVGSWSKGRTVSRNGKRVRVIYYQYTKNLWDLMLPGDWFAYHESASNYGEIYSDSAALEGEIDHLYISYCDSQLVRL